MKEILQALWAAFVLLVFVGIAVLKCESDRIKQQRTIEWLTPKTPPAAGPKTAPADPFGLNGGSMTTPRFAPIERTELERQRQSLEDWEKSKLRRTRSEPAEVPTPAAPMPREKPPE